METFSSLNHKLSDFPVAAKYQDEILSLPMYPELKIDMMNYVANTIKEFYNK